MSPYQRFNNSSDKPLGYQDSKLVFGANHCEVKNKNCTKRRFYSKCQLSEQYTDCYFLSYFGDGNKAQNYSHWLQRASELCPNGYRILMHEEYTRHGSIRSPVNGMMMTLGTQHPVDRGVVQCSKVNKEQL